MARRKPAATTRKPRTRSRPNTGARPSTTAAPAGGDGPPTSQGTKGASTTVEPEALVVSHWFDSGDDGEPYTATIRLTGRRLGIHGLPKPGDTFVQEDTIQGIVPGSGAVSVSSWVYGLTPGEWSVTADMTRPDGHVSAGEPADRWRRSQPERLPRARWSWRGWRLSDSESVALHTRWALTAPLARIPAVIPGSFTLMGAIAIATAIVVLSALLARDGVPVVSSLVVSLLALTLGLIGAKLWHAVLHPGPWPQALAGGWSVDGFLVVAPVVAIGALVALDLSIGLFLDAAAPAIFFAVAIGRFGCFFTGCCAGRCTRSRWGVWSSDRRMGARRIPAQLLESAVGLIIGIATAAVLLGRGGGSGEVFVTAIAVYIIARQFLLRVRAERREFSWRRSRLAAQDGAPGRSL